jgi:hypothetical protein
MPHCTGQKNNILILLGYTRIFARNIIKISHEQHESARPAQTVICVIRGCNIKSSEQWHRLIF